MYSEERHNVPRQLRPWNTVTAVDLTSAAASGGKIFISPGGAAANSGLSPGITGYTLKRFGMVMAAAGGAQTTAGTLKLTKNGTAIQIPSGTNVNIASVASHAAGSLVEVDLNSSLLTATALAGTTPSLVTLPVYPTCVPGDILEFVVDTTGVGSDQTAFPYVVVVETPPAPSPNN